MAREGYGDFQAFLAISRERSFTRAAAQLGVSQSALSHTIRTLEARLGVRLLTRTTRSVTPTEAGEQLFQKLSSLFAEVDAEIAEVIELGDAPRGNLRISATDYAANAVLWPRLKDLLLQYPDIKIEITTDYGLTDIVAERYDIGVRLGDQIAQDMIAVRIGPDLRMAMVASPDYFKGRAMPASPSDLGEHNCINLRLPTHGGCYPWELSDGESEVQVRVSGQLTFNGTYPMLAAAIDGCGIAYLPEELVREHVAAGRLVWVLENWFPTFPGLHIYYPSRRQSSRALSLVVEALRFSDRDS
ncbi:LysR family transcriptional regulator [Pseudomonas sp. BP8]|uniref:LysR family transcriptional regulator n=1 Tax=Pseudomonas sp. BP8 TaxID=2817864 RepID=UPI001AE532E8|nr:LysR family transcriptional regulator [Pseudomonas sp. BP8]MBP2262382.1 DNA-binding transcriptional LysR family regulator [Pseudomonas sp. BP8]HDS1733297.1 LysR family transcriptional regulator [Pseudomonas putida]